MVLPSRAATPDGDADREVDGLMREQGKARVRTIVQLRRPLPLEAAPREGIPEITTRPFELDRDGAGLLSVNNAAFAWHPEQGGWDRERLESALAEPWVDPAGILVHERTEVAVAGPGAAPASGSVSIDGFCWTRIHPADDPEQSTTGDPALGEIWVIATDPVRRGHRLGPALVVAGLDHLAASGLHTAMLYTEEDNLAARRMYDRLGFAVHERRGGYR